MVLTLTPEPLSPIRQPSALGEVGMQAASEGLNNMRILWVYDTLSAPLVQLATNLAKRPDISLEVMCRWQDQAPLDRSLVPLTKLCCRSKLDFHARRAIRSRVRTGRYDIVTAYTSKALANVLGALRGVSPQPRVLGYRGTVNQLHLLDPANWITFWHPRLTKTICVCQATQRALCDSGIPSSKLETVWEGCCLDKNAQLARTQRREFQIPDAAFVVGVVANMRPVKGVDLLLRAALQLADLSDIYWLLIGEVRDARVHELAQDPRITDRVRLPGARAGGGRYASLFDVYASPSRMEGMPMAVMEAMHQGVGVVTTAVGGCGELVRDMQDGLVVAPEEPAALASAIHLLYQNRSLRRQLAQSAQHRATQVFSIDAWADRLANVYHSVLQSDRRQAA